MLSVDTRVFTSPVWTVRCSANPATSSLFVLYNKHAKAFREFDLLGHFPRYLFALCLCSSRYKMLFMMMMMMMWWCYCLVQFKCRFLGCLSILMFDVCSCSVQYFYIVWTVKICTVAGIPRLVNANKLHVNFAGSWGLNLHQFYTLHCPLQAQKYSSVETYPALESFHQSYLKRDKKKNYH